MKKSLLLAGGAVLASVILSGCAGVSVNQGAPGAVSMGPNFYSEYCQLHDFALHRSLHCCQTRCESLS